MTADQAFDHPFITKSVAEIRSMFMSKSLHSYGIEGDGDTAAEALRPRK